MSYTPKSEEQLALEACLPEGAYDFEVADTDDKPSKVKADGTGGNPMYTLKLHVFEETGSPRVLTDYIALGNNFGERKLRHAAVACGLLETYGTGNLTPADFMGKTGKVQLKIQKGTPEYPNPKNVVSDYLPKDEQEPARKAAFKTPPYPDATLDDEIPFAWALPLLPLLLLAQAVA